MLVDGGQIDRGTAGLESTAAPVSGKVSVTVESDSSTGPGGS